MKYFAVKGGDGKYHTAFDACDACFSHKKGYVKDGNDALCNNCGLKFSIDGLGDANADGGGCWPGYLPHTIQEGNLHIKLTDIEAGTWYFE